MILNASGVGITEAKSFGLKRALKFGLELQR